jgi:hypothetical protein
MRQIRRIIRRSTKPPPSPEEIAMMTRTSARVLLWSPRILGMLMSLFLSLFALDAFSAGRPFSGSLSDFVIHLVPALLLLAIVAISWRWEWFGGVSFIALAAAYVAIARGRLDWVLLISGPLVVIGACFLWSWRHHNELHAVK